VSYLLRYKNEPFIQILSRTDSEQYPIFYRYKSFFSFFLVANTKISLYIDQ